MATTRQRLKLLKSGPEHTTGLLRRVEQLEARVQELEAGRPKKAAPKPAEK